MTPPRLSEVSLLELFRLEIEAQGAILTQGLLALEGDSQPAARLNELMRAAHSLKGAARIVNRDAAVHVAHTMEDCFVSAQRQGLTLGAAHIDALLAAVDLLKDISRHSDEEAAAKHDEHEGQLQRCRARLAAATGQSGGEPIDTTGTPVGETASLPARSADLGLRIDAAHLDRLLRLSGEVSVSARWVGEFTRDVLQLKRLRAAAIRKIELVADAIKELDGGRPTLPAMVDLRAAMTAWEQAGARRAADLDAFDRRLTTLSDRLQQEVLDSRMRPFADGIQSLPRLVRDLSRALSKRVRLEIAGEATPVDRMVLERLDAPLGHLVRNAIDHGIEDADERRANRKPPEGTVRVEARCSGGKLVIVVSDDGRGIDFDRLRAVIIERALAAPDVAATLSEAELLEFLFLPGFTLKATVTEVSGRGVGLDVVQTMARQMSGSVRVAARAGAGVEFQLHLPLTLTVVRAIIAELGGEPYGFPLSRVAGVLQVRASAVESIEGRQHALFRGERLGLVAAAQVLGLADPPADSDDISVIVLGERGAHVGLVVDRLVGDAELVTRPLDPRLGKLKDIASAALMPDGSPVLVVDIEDLRRSVEHLVSGGRLARCAAGAGDSTQARRTRLLVVDDSLTVRELERKLLVAAGYEVEVAVDGMDGWNAVRTGGYDLVVTDVDMPRVDGIELVTLIRRDPKLQSLPVMIVSYKDRDEDRRRGLEAGADYYLAKANFHDNVLLDAVRDLIGAAR